VFSGVAAGIRRLTRNKIFMCNVFSGVFYLFGTCGFLNFITKYLEVQFDLSAAVANLIIGNNLDTPSPCPTNTENISNISSRNTNFSYALG